MKYVGLILLSVLFILLGAVLSGCTPSVAPSSQTAPGLTEDSSNERRTGHSEPPPNPSHDYITCLAISPDGRWALTGRLRRKDLTLWDLATARKVRSWKAHDREVSH